MSRRPATTVPHRVAAAHPSVVRLARQIVALAAADRWPVGRHLIEADLVATLGVSRTPVRAALRLLSAEGIVDARPNQGVFLARSGATLATFDLEQALTAPEVLYSRLLRDHIEGRLPRTVSPASLTERYGVGRVVLAQALGRLADDGLIERGAGRSWTFPEALTDARSVRASYEFRRAIEPAAIRASGFRADREALTRLRDRHRALVERLMGKQHEEAAPPSLGLRALIVGLDADFHGGLADLSGNPFAAAAVKQQVALRRLLEFGIREQPSRVAQWCAEHIAILDALLADAPDDAATLLERHLEQAEARTTPVGSDQSGEVTPITSVEAIAVTPGSRRSE